MYIPAKTNTWNFYDSEARILLENGASVQATAERLGFYDAFHFYKTFKKFWAKPPSSHRPA